VVGTATGDGQLTVKPTPLRQQAGRHADGSPARQAAAHDAQRAHAAAAVPPLRRRRGLDLKEAAAARAAPAGGGLKNFLITIGDRSVGGLTARDQMVGPWQVPVADVAVTTMGYDTAYRGEAFAMGERTPLACSTRRPPAAWRSARRSPTWPPPMSATRQGQALGQLDGRRRPPRRGRGAVRHRAAVGIDFCPQLGVAIPVGKDSLSMRTAWEEAGRKKQVVSPLSLIVTAFAAVDDVRRTLTPQLRPMPRWAKPNCC
jgi:phosphoribosylformylglycinamidine synthase